MASPSSLERDVSINELLAKHTGHDLLREMPRILLLRFPDRVSEIPSETQVAQQDKLTCEIDASAVLCASRIGAPKSAYRDCSDDLRGPANLRPA